MGKQVFLVEYRASNEIILHNDAIGKLKKGVYFINVETGKRLEKATIIKR